ncbi:MAG: hypothetical protein L3K26_14215 [Candidatus Hydrogenedentes bacterium]|nr:hypothetical protein [Candidatus Hydrogenedentota bacterium]
MSEYQYYEFQALDTPLSSEQMADLRAYSSRARITPASFVNEYNWGRFKGNETQWMEEYFDAYLYLANWGTHFLEFRVPKELLANEAASYWVGDSLTYRSTESHAILSFHSECEDGEWEEGDGWLAALIPLRADIMDGDYRCLYLAWLMAAQDGRLPDDTEEPLVPAGLGTLSAPLESLVDFLRINEDLLVAAAEQSAEIAGQWMTDKQAAAWVATLPVSEKDAILVSLLKGQDPHLGSKLRRRALREIHAANGSAEMERGRRTVAEIMVRAEVLGKERREREVRQHARKQAERAHKEAKQREERLKSIVGKEESLWKEAEELIATKQPQKYGQALALLLDLRDAAALVGQEDGFEARMKALHTKHARKYALAERLRKAGLAE